MASELKFSVIIPTYNRSDRIVGAIRSILNQTYADFEIIVVDDGSTDDTQKIISTIEDPRVHYVFQSNKERGAARNTGTKLATGDYITFLDSDDEFLPNHLETVNKFIQKHRGYDVFCTSYKMRSKEKTNSITMPDNIRLKLLKGNFLSCNGVFLPRKIANDFLFSEDRSMSGLEDWELWLRIASKKSMIGNKEYTSVMNQHDDRSVLQTTRQKIEDRFDSFYKHVFMNPEVVGSYKRKLRRLKASGDSYIALHLALTKKHRAASLKYLFSAFFKSPSLIFTKRFYATLKHII